MKKKLLDATLTLGRRHHICKLFLELFHILVDRHKLFLKICLWKNIFKKVNSNFSPAPLPKRSLRGSHKQMKKKVNMLHSKYEDSTYSQTLLLLPAPLYTLPALETNLSSHSSCTEPAGCSLSPTFQSCEEGDSIKWYVKTQWPTKTHR